MEARTDEPIELAADQGESALAVAQRAQIIAMNARRVVRIYWRDVVHDARPELGARQIERDLISRSQSDGKAEPKPLVYQVPAGQYLHTAIAAAIGMARREKSRVEFTHNGLTLEVGEDDDADAVGERWRQLDNARRAAERVHDERPSRAWRVEPASRSERDIKAAHFVEEILGLRPKPRVLLMGTLDICDVNGDKHEAQVYGRLDSVSGRMVVDRIDLPVGRMFDGRELDASDLHPRLAEPLRGRRGPSPVQVLLDEVPIFGPKGRTGETEETEEWTPAIDSLWTSNSRSDGMQYRVVSIHGGVVRLEPRLDQGPGTTHGVRLEGFRDAFTAVGGGIAE